MSRALLFWALIAHEFLLWCELGSTFDFDVDPAAFHFEKLDTKLDWQRKLKSSLQRSVAEPWQFFWFWFRLSTGYGSGSGYWQVTAPVPDPGYEFFHPSILNPNFFSALGNMIRDVLPDPDFSHPGSRGQKSTCIFCFCVQVQKSHGCDPVNSDPHWVSALATLHNTDLVCTGSRQGTMPANIFPASIISSVWDPFGPKTFGLIRNHFRYGSWQNSYFKKIPLKDLNLKRLGLHTAKGYISP